MKHFRMAINRLIDLSERDQKTEAETIETLEYYFMRLKDGQRVIQPHKKRERQLTDET